MHVERLGESGPTVVLVHGSVTPGWATWEAQRPLADRYRLVVPHRTGYPPNPPLERIDFEAQAGEIAELVEPGAHLVGHSYGGVVSLLAAGLVPEQIASLTVIEPPAFGLVRGIPAVEDLIARLTSIIGDTRLSPREYVDQFAQLIGATPVLPDPLPAAMEASVRAAMRERSPVEAEPPVEALAQRPVPEARGVGPPQSRLRRRLRLPHRPPACGTGSRRGSGPQRPENRRAIQRTSPDVHRRGLTRRVVRCSERCADAA